MAAEPSAAHEWSAREPTYADAMRELRCIFRWGMRHWLWVLLLSSLAAAGLGVRKYRKPHVFTSTVVIEVRANALVDEGPPPSARELTGFIHGVALSDSMLAQVMRTLRYDTARLQSTRSDALQDMRDLIGLSISHDTLGASDRASARIGLSFTSIDPEAALAIARALAEHVVSFQTRGRQEGAETHRELVVQTEQELQERLRTSEASLNNLRRRYSLGTLQDQEDLRPRLREAEVETQLLLERVEQAGHNRRAAVLRSTFERDVSGLKYEVVDRGRLSPPKRFTRAQEAGMVAVISWVGLLPTLVLAIGGLSFRVYDGDSLRRLGLHAFGEGSLRNPTAHSLRARLKADKRAAKTRRRQESQRPKEHTRV